MSTGVWWSTGSTSAWVSDTHPRHLFRAKLTGSVLDNNVYTSGWIGNVGLSLYMRVNTIDTPIAGKWSSHGGVNRPVLLFRSRSFQNINVPIRMSLTSVPISGWIALSFLVKAIDKNPPSPRMGGAVRKCMLLEFVNVQADWGRSWHKSDPPAKWR